MLDTLGLDDDLDPVEAVAAIEKAFDVGFNEAEVKHIFQVGEMYDLLLKKLPLSGGNGKCASAMAYYRLRRALGDWLTGERLSPSFDLSRFDKEPTKAFFKDLERTTGLNLPQSEPSWVGRLGGRLALYSFLALVICWGVAIPAAQIGWPHAEAAGLAVLVGALFGIVSGYVLSVIDPGRIPDDCRTLSGLAQKTAILSYGRLVKLGAAAREQEIWKMLVTVLSEVACVPADEIGPDTFFLQSGLDRRKPAA